MIVYPGNVAAFCGRRFGKGEAYVQRLFYFMGQQPGLYWWVGLSWRSASLKRAWRLTSDIARQILKGMGLPERGHINRSTFEIDIPGLGMIWFRTADNPSSLAGEGVRGAVVDEFSLMPENVWTEYIEGTLIDYDGWVAFSGVPKGNNWAAHLWRAAGHRDNWLQIHATSFDNPHISHKRLEVIKGETPESMWKQEYLAEILEDGAVFRGLSEVSYAQEQKYKDYNLDHTYVIGVDWGKFEDYSVFTVVDATTGEACYVDRSNKIDYTTQVERLAALAKRFDASAVHVEANAQETTLELLRKEKLPLVEWTATNDSKAEVINALIVAFEKKDLRIIPDPVLLAELQSFEATRLPSGRIRYAAPEGYHDDCVMSLALAWQAAKTHSRPVTVTYRRMVR